MYLLFIKDAGAPWLCVWHAPRLPRTLFHPLTLASPVLPLSLDVYLPGHSLDCQVSLRPGLASNWLGPWQE